jgi:Rrf2 family protein
MKISKKSQYGLRAMVELASCNKQDPVSARFISSQQDIPLQYLEQIFNRLKKEKLIKTIRGPRGGYLLARRPSEIKVRDVIKALEGDCSIIGCLLARPRPSCNLANTCATKIFWKRLNDNINKILDSTNLKDLCLMTPKKSGNNNTKNIEHSYIFQI